MTAEWVPEVKLAFTLHRYGPLSLGEGLVGWGERVWDELFGPAFERLRGLGGGLVESVGIGGNTGKLTRQRWVRGLGRLSSGEIDDLDASMGVQPQGREIWESLYIYVVMFSTDASTYPSSVQVLLPGEALPDRSAVWRQMVVGHFLEAARLVEAVGGFLTWDRVSLGWSALQTLLGSAATHIEGELDVRVPGYQWGTLLSSGHVALLGGLGRVRAEAPVERVVEVLPEGRLVFLQLTAEFEAPSPEVLRPLKAYLSDLLPQRCPGEPVRPLSQPLVGLVDEPDYRVEPVRCTYSVMTPKEGISEAEAWAKGLWDSREVSEEEFRALSPRWSDEGSDESLGSSDPWDFAGQVTVRAQSALTAQQRQQLEGLIYSWYDSALAGAFGPPVHWMSQLEWFVGDDGDSVQATVDLGSAGPAVYEPLQAMVTRWSADTGVPARLLLGPQPEDT